MSKGRQLREGGDASAAMTQFQDAAALDDHNPVPLRRTGRHRGKPPASPRRRSSIGKRSMTSARGAGLYFSLAEAKLKAAHALTRPGSAPPGTEDSPDLTAPLEGIAAGALLGLLPITPRRPARRQILH
ncbi:MAG: hypothetical protein WDN28_17555, partial [Chthoniobacter sp.]